MTGNRSNRKLLNIEEFKMCFDGEHGAVHAVQDVSLAVNSGEIVAIVGESGSGKTALCFSILMLHAHNARYLSGRIELCGHNVLEMSERELEHVRGELASMVFQDPLNSLDPVRTIGEQIIAPMQIHDGIKLSGIRRDKDIAAYERRAAELLRDMDMDDAEAYLNCYPHQLSGGQRQRVAIAVALACDPQLIIADEPTTALDPDTQSQIISLLKRIAADRGKGILFVTHDLGLARGLASRIFVMKDGKVIESGDTEQIFENPQQEYTQALVRYSRYGNKDSHYHGHRAQTASQFAEAYGKKDSYYHEYSEDSGSRREQAEQADTIVQVRDVDMTYKTGTHGVRKVLDRFSMEVMRGEILGLVGKSGCGKSTLARIIMGLVRPTGGEVGFGSDGTDRRDSINAQMIFQDSASAFNPRMTLEQIISEPLVIARIGNRAERLERVSKVMTQVHLDIELMKRHPYDVSGGQRQRTAIARALITDPEFIIADEPLSSLDVPTQAEIVHLLRELHDERQLTMILISHDIPMVEHVCDRIIDMEAV